MDAVMHNSQLLKGPSLLQCCPPELCSRHTAGRPRRYLQYDPHTVVVESLQFLLELFGTVSPYHTAVSRWGSTIALNSIFLVFIGRCLLTLLSIPRFLPTFLATLSICCFQLSLSSMSTPRYFAVRSFLIGWPSCSMCGSTSSRCLLFLPRNIVWVFLKFTRRQFSWNHWFAVWKATVSFCLTSATVFPWQYSMVSSAYSWVSHDMISAGSLFMNTMNNRGPRIEPWGTPLLIGLKEDLALPMLTHCVRSYK